MQKIVTVPCWLQQKKRELGSSHLHPPNSSKDSSKRTKNFFFLQEKRTKMHLWRPLKNSFLSIIYAKEKVGSSQFIIDILISKLQPSHCSENLIYVQKFNFDKTLFLDIFEFSRQKSRIWPKIWEDKWFEKFKFTWLNFWTEKGGL